MEQLQNYIGGKMSEPASRKYLENFDPSNGSVYSLIPDSDELDVQAAVSSTARPEVSTTGQVGCRA